ncbi:MAG: heat-shock protein [Methanolobus sp.]|nr:heat-shock protein [Methanolobus sp.]
MNMEFNADNPFVQAIAVSTTLAVFMIGVAMGIMNLAKTGSSSVPVPIILLIFAVIFIAGSVYFENRGADYMGSLIGGAIASFVATFSATSFFTGVNYAFTGGISDLGSGQIISALAICMVVSMLIIRTLQHKLQSPY